ncbi:hypothetical protein [Mesorhizobium sp.]|uniref:hypothetical protein n=1 Tax=Mesorhizobium sp. TaxID=1871066 RepID=UPI00120C6C5D|nr:hypothetical protein [Mesorhizobium sp.]TIN84365.1 MAG: hypothetical protein E5X97_22620 [Mesorhizobium sp.]
MAALNYVSDGPWGTGTGAPLNVGQFDGNTYELAQRIAAIVADIPEPLNISNITLTGTQMRIYLEDGTVFGPFTLPQASFRPSVVGEIDGGTDGTWAPQAGDLNGYKRYAGSGALTVLLPGDGELDVAVDSEITFRQVGAGPIGFDGSTDVVINGMDGFLKRTAGQGSTVTAKKVAASEWDLIGRLAEDVTA